VCMGVLEKGAGVSLDQTSTTQPSYLSKQSQHQWGTWAHISYGMREDLDPEFSVSCSLLMQEVFRVQTEGRSQSIPFLASHRISLSLYYYQ
jgi:hypothetical protein